jgi:transposase-like protein
MRKEKFPETLIEAVRYFSDEGVCRDFVEQLRWPDGVTCPRCEGTEIGRITSRNLWRCKSCPYEFTVKKGTIFEDSPIALSKWLPALWMYSNFTKGVSSHQLAKHLGVTQKTAWFMAHRIRLAMEVGGIDRPLSGEIEADETSIGGKAKFQHESRRTNIGTGPVDKTIVAGLLERGGDVRAKVVPSRRKGTLQAHVRTSILPGSTVYTDALKSYEGLDGDCIHGVIDHAERYVEGRIHTNGLENFWSLFKRMVYGTHRSVDPEHLGRYLAEATACFSGHKATASARFTTITSGIVGKRIT